MNAGAPVLECAHCGALVERPAAVWLDDRPYCCTGCRGVAQLVRDGGWDAFYDRRDGPSPRPADDENVAVFDRESFTRGRVQALSLDRSAVDLQLGGLRCAACTWLVERAVGAFPGVHSAEVSYGSGRAHIEYDPTQVKLSEVAARIAAVGYRALVAETSSGLDTDLVVRFGVASFCAMNAMLLSIAVYTGWFDSSGMDEGFATLFRFTTLLLATPATLYAAEPFFVGATAGLRHRFVSMDVPIAIAIAVLYAHGVVETFRGHDAYLDSLTMLIALLLGGRLLEASGRRRAHDAAAAVLSTAPTVARRVVGDRVEEVAADSLQVGDQVVVGAGAVVPADAYVVAGAGLVDLSMLTGESEPVALALSQHLPAGALLREGEATLVVAAVGEGTVVARMAARVSAALSARARIARLPDRIAPWFTGATLLVAAGTFVAWALRVGPGGAMPATIAVLVVACPCALALATPTALAAGIGAAARRGAWLRDPDVLLALARVDTVAVDKTGTVTEGRPRVVSASDEHLRLAAALERGSQHPIARAILDEAHARRIPIGAATDVREQPGVGIEGRIGDRHVALRRVPEGVGVFIDGARCGAIDVRDRVRADAARDLRALGLPVTMLSGDDPARVAEVAATCGGLDAAGGLSPDAKAAWIADRRAAGARVLFAGDGLNDAPALAAADVGAAMGSGASATVLAADVVVLEPSLRPVAAAVRAARTTANTLRALTAISITYNVSAVGAAALGLVNPLVAAVLMPLSSLVVIVGALSIEWRMRHGDHLRPAPALARDGVALRGALRPSRA